MTEDLSFEIYSVGHSNHPIEEFVGLLKRHQIEVVADSRSYPSSKYAPQYNSPVLRRVLNEVAIRYLFLGKELGGRPKDLSYYDDKGRVLYYKLAQSQDFCAGIARLRIGASKFRVAVLCSEEDPSTCHRSLLIGKVLAMSGYRVKHIRGNGSIETEEDVQAQRKQLGMFDRDESQAWKSSRSVLQRDRLRTSFRR